MHSLKGEELQCVRFSHKSIFLLKIIDEINTFTFTFRTKKNQTYTTRLKQKLQKLQKWQKWQKEHY